MATATTTKQRLVDDYFDREAPAWSEIYLRSDVHSLIHQQRRDLALEWIRALCLPAGARVLEIGCGTGTLAVSLAQVGFDVTATDTVGAMLDRARQRAHAAGVEDRVHVRSADAHALDLPDGGFDVAVALGVLHWLPAPAVAAREMARVTRPGGHVLANTDNLNRLTRIVDPLKNPLLRRPRRLFRRALMRAGIAAERATPRQYRPREFDRLFEAAGLEILRRSSYGFGPFTFLGVPCLTEHAGVRLHEVLQRRADGGTRALRSSGAQYVVLARRRPVATG
jgi:ubiquinone/menaquinone biosynthesis C-methylase UbiE